MIIDCPVCKKPCKNLTSHLRASHPDYNGNPDFGKPVTEPPQEEPVNPTPEAPDYSEVIAGLLNHLKAQDTAIHALNKRLEELGQSAVQAFNEIPKQVDLMVKQRVDQIASEFAPQLDRLLPAVQEQPGQTPQGRSRLSEIAAIAQVLGPLLGMGGAPAQPNMQALTAQFAAFKQVADLFQAPYSNGVRDTLNMITTAYKVGVPVENLSEAFKKMSGAEEKKLE